MADIKIKQRKIFRTRRDGQVNINGSYSSTSSSSTSSSSGSSINLSNYVKLSGETSQFIEGDLLVGGNVVAYAEGATTPTSIFDNIPWASTSSKGIAQFDGTDFSVVDGVVKYIGNAGLDETQLDAYMIEGEYITETSLAAKNYLTTHQSLTGYATETFVTSKNYLTEHQDLSDYATQTWVNNKNYLTTHQDLSDYLTEHQDLSDYATQTWVNNKNYLTEHQSLSAYSKTVDIWTKLDIPNLDKITIDENGNLFVTGNITAYSDEISGGSIFDNLPIASTTSKGIAQFNPINFSVVDGYVSVTNAGLNETQLSDYLDTNNYATESFVTNKNYLTTHQSLTNYATKSYVGDAISDLVDSSPATLDTLNELAAALGDDPNFATTITTSIGTKCAGDDSRLSDSRPASDVYSWAKAANKPTYTYSEVGAAASNHSHSYLPLSGGTLTGDLEFGSGAKIIANSLYFKNIDGNTTTYPFIGFYQWGSQWQVNARNSSNVFVHNLLTIDTITKVAEFSATPKVNGTNVSLSGHTHSYLPLTGGTMSGTIFGSDSKPILQVNTSAAYLGSTTRSGVVLASINRPQWRDSSSVYHNLALDSTFGSYLPKTGGTLSGNLTLGNNTLYFNSATESRAYINGGSVLAFGSDDTVQFFESDDNTLRVNWSLNSGTFNFIGTLQEDGYSVYHTGRKPSYSDVGAEKSFTKNTAFNKNFGTSHTTVAYGDHSHSYLPLTGGTLDNGTSTMLTIKCDDAGEAVLELRGDNQGTGRLFVGQSTTYGGGIMYNGVGTPTYSGAGADYVTLYRVNGGTPYWTARNQVGSNDWIFRGAITATSFSGNASSATKLATARTISLTGDASGSITFDGSANKAITVVVANDSHTHDGRYYTETESNSRFAYKAGSTSQSFSVNTLTATTINTTNRIKISNSTGGDGGWDNCGLILDNTSTSTGEAAVSYKNAGSAGTGSNYWMHGLNHSNIFKWAYGTSFTDGNMKLQLDISGNLTAAGNITAYSDMRVKKFIKPFQGVLSNLNDLDTFYYQRTDIEDKESLHIGVSAQQVQKLYPEFITILDDERKTLTVDYGKLGTSIAISGLKEVKSEMDLLKERIIELEKQLKKNHNE